MKKLLFVTFFLPSALALPAQDYIPLVQEQATWVNYKWDGGTFEENDLFGYRIEGDTTIDGTAYKKVYRLGFFIDQWPFVPYRKSGQALFGAIREDIDERKVYARIFEESEIEHRCTDLGAEKLWYDFSLEVGDTLPSCISGWPDHPEWTWPIDSFDTAFLFGEDRDRWSVLYGYAYQVEGLGTHTGLFDPCFGCITTGESSYTLEHYCIGSESDCGIVDATATRERLLPVSALKVFPNPATDQVHIILEKLDSGIERVSLLTLTGALLLEKTNEGGNGVDLDVRGARPGVYLLQVITTNGIAVAKIVLQ
ncbi:MAG: T9SS type A sorting domain-containing protein [Saprospirales bacterium]|nr:T9SS type A sorting domain-containing protein [Saprospirales bacterium]